jgi:hypothetical protein
MPLVELPEDYLAGKDVPLKLGTSVVGTLMEGSYEIDSKTDDLTNHAGGGWEDDVLTTKGAMGSFKVAYKPDTPLIQSGASYALLIDAGAVWPGIYLSGNVRVTKVSVPFGNVKGGITQTFSWKSRGAMVAVRPGP